MNRDRLVHDILKITKGGGDRKKGILKPLYQENVIRILSKSIGNGYEIIRKVDSRGGKDFYW